MSHQKGPERYRGETVSDRHSRTPADSIFSDLKI